MLNFDGCGRQMHRRSSPELAITEREIEKIAVRAIRENRHHRAAILNRSGDVKEETVHIDKLERYIDTTILQKRGCALLIDGVCLYKGQNVKADLIEKWLTKMTDRWVPPIKE